MPTLNGRKMLSSNEALKELIANTYIELNRHNVGPVPQAMGRHYSAIGSMPCVS